MRVLVAMAALAVTLAACGRVGPIRPPGPPDQVTYPRQYPAVDRPRTPAAPSGTAARP